MMTLSPAAFSYAFSCHFACTATPRYVYLLFRHLLMPIADAFIFFCFILLPLSLSFCFSFRRFADVLRRC